ncbi:putative transcriptional regulator [Allochromatium warmingii]|uniref:Putative transcriptional regulator n=1 Tax=Allochromatium warmingii TaxID=61595 RepID=A0A1H3F5H3_ALLWA|nr:transcriptional regulator [Allochromatium warmingii]SDX86107.1 putative transcriptional regulator [Allochromatium warmingii]
MSNAFIEIMSGLNDAKSHAQGQSRHVIEHAPDCLNVKAIREKTGMNPQRFCATLGISLNTLKHWEQGSKIPRGSARILLKVVDKNPQVVIKAIAD